MIMANFGIGLGFHDLEYFEVELFFFTFLDFIINLKAPSQKIIGQHQFYVILSCFKQF